MFPTRGAPAVRSAKGRIAACLFCCVVLSAGAVFGQHDSLELSLAANYPVFQARLARIIDDALKNNPSLRASENKIDGARAAVDYAKSLDPPQVAVEFYNAPVSSFPNPFKNQMEYDYSIQQMFPFPGKLRSMAKAEQKRTGMLTADRQTLQQEIVRNVKTLYFDLYLKYRQSEINHETQMLVREFVDIARKQYEVRHGKTIRYSACAD